MPQILCVIPRDRDDGFCAVTSGFLAHLFELATNLDVSMFALPSETADPGETTIDAAYAQLIQEAERSEAFLAEAVSVTVNAGRDGVGILLAGVGRRIRDHQYRALIELDEPVEGATELVIGAVRSGIVPPGDLDEIKFLQADLTEAVCDFALRIARCYADGGSIESARQCWRKVLEVTDGASFDASYSLGTSYVWSEGSDQAPVYLDLAEQAAQGNRQRAIVQFQRGMLVLSGGDDVGACGCFETCIEGWPACGMAYVGLAHAHARAGDRVSALSALKRCLSLPEDEAAELGDSRQQAEALLRELGI
jgi:tetratricopeptide (TPR) repeat protein